MEKLKESAEKLKISNLRLNIPNFSDNLTISSELKLNQEKENLELDRLRMDLKNLQEVFSLSKWLGICIFIIVGVSLLAVFGIVIWQGIIPIGYRLDYKVMIALLTSTTADIIGLLLFVVKYVFHHRLKIH